jgi:hypothetical protein
MHVILALWISASAPDRQHADPHAPWPRESGARSGRQDDYEPRQRPIASTPTLTPPGLAEAGLDPAVRPTTSLASARSPARQASCPLASRKRGSIRPSGRLRASPAPDRQRAGPHAPWPRGSGARSGRQAAYEPRQRSIASAPGLMPPALAEAGLDPAARPTTSLASARSPASSISRPNPRSGRGQAAKAASAVRQAHQRQRPAPARQRRESS